MQPTRHRAASVALAALFAAAPLAFGTAAHAGARVHGGGSAVTFSGAGLLAVACTSTASANSLTVPAKSALRVVNNAGHRATVLLDQAATGETARGAHAKLLSHEGLVSLALQPGCVFAETFSVPVHVVAPPTVRQAAPPAVNLAASATIGGNTTSGSGGTTAGAGPPNAAAQPEVQADPERAGGGETSAAPDAGTDITAGEPPVSVERVSETGRTGLLAMIATVCVVGVSAGAIRAIAAQRATRTPSA